MKKNDLLTLLQLADLARTTGQIAFDAMPLVAAAVQNAQTLLQKMKDDDTLAIQTATETQPGESK